MTTKFDACVWMIAIYPNKCTAHCLCLDGAKLRTEAKIRISGCESEAKVE